MAARAPRHAIPDGHIFTQPWAAGAAGRKDRVIYYQFRAERAHRTLRGIDQQVAKAKRAVAGLAPVKRNRFIKLDGAAKSVNRDLKVKAWALAALKGYITNLPGATPEFVIGAYHLRPGRSTTAMSPPARTSRSCSQPWPSPAGSKAAPPGRTRSL